MFFVLDMKSLLCVILCRPLGSQHQIWPKQSPPFTLLNLDSVARQLLQSAAFDALIQRAATILVNKPSKANRALRRNSWQKGRTILGWIQ